MSHQHPFFSPTFDIRKPGAIDALIGFHRTWALGFKMVDPPSPTPPAPTPNPTDPPAPVPNPTDPTADPGFPVDTPVEQMTDKQAAAYWKHHSKQHESRVKGLSKVIDGRTADQIKAEREELERLRSATQTDQEKAVAEAEARGRSAATQALQGELVKAKFEAALGHVDENRRNTIIEGLTLASFLTPEGNVDADRVKAYATAVAPVVKTNNRWDLGAGQRPEGGGTSRGSAGKAEAQRRFASKQNLTTG